MLKKQVIYITIKRYCHILLCAFSVLVTTSTNVLADDSNDSVETETTQQNPDSEESVVDIIIKMLVPGGTHQPPP